MDFIAGVFKNQRTRTTLYHRNLLLCMQLSNYSTKELPPWGKVLLEKVIFAQVAKKLAVFMEPKNSVSSLKPAIGPYPEPEKSSPHFHTRFL